MDSGHQRHVPNLVGLQNLKEVKNYHVNVESTKSRSRELTGTFKKMKVNIACIRETKRVGDKAKEIGDGYTTILYTRKTTRRNRVGKILDTAMKTKVVEVINSKNSIQ